MHFQWVFVASKYARQRFCSRKNIFEFEHLFSGTLTHALIPQITSITDNYGIIGTRLELTCTVISEMLLHNLNVTWTTPTVDIAQKV